MYKPCTTFKGRFQNPRILFTCNDGLGHQGRYVYIRDDRRDQDYFGLCEVEVFAYRGGEDSATYILIYCGLSRFPKYNTHFSLQKSLQNLTTYYVCPSSVLLGL